MTLGEILAMFEDTTVRIFAGPTTIFHGKRNDVPERTWNMRVGPYMKCEVANSLAHNGTVLLLI